MVDDIDFAIRSNLTRRTFQIVLIENIILEDESQGSSGGSPDEVLQEGVIRLGVRGCDVYTGPSYDVNGCVATQETVSVFLEIVE